MSAQQLYPSPLSGSTLWSGAKLCRFWAAAAPAVAVLAANHVPQVNLHLTSANQLVRHKSLHQPRALNFLPTVEQFPQFAEGQHIATFVRGDAEQQTAALKKGAQGELYLCCPYQQAKQPGQVIPAHSSGMNDPMLHLRQYPFLLIDWQLCWKPTNQGKLPTNVR